MGNLEAATAASDIINTWNPRYIIVNGIAAGLDHKSQNFGDIVVSESIIYYEIVKIVGTQMVPRNEQFLPDQTLLARVLNFTNGDWRFCLPTRPDRKPSNDTYPKVHIGPIASGAKVIAAAHAVNDLKLHQRNLIAIEMESAGVAFAAFGALKKVGFIAVRAICDFADASKSDQWYEYATKSAAAYLRAFLENHPVAFSEGRWPKPAVPMRLAKTTDILLIRRHLFNSICKAVDIEEFKNFCFLIGADFDDLAGDRKSSNVRELILLFERHGKLHSLLDAVTDLLGVA